MMGSLTRLGSPARQRTVRPSLLPTGAGDQLPSSVPSAPRRSSAAGIGHQRPPLPPSTLSTRCQSLDDGLMETAADAVDSQTTNSSDIEGASETQHATTSDKRQRAVKPTKPRYTLDLNSDGSKLAISNPAMTMAEEETPTPNPRRSRERAASTEPTTPSTPTESLSIGSDGVSRELSEENNSGGSGSTLSGETADGGSSRHHQQQPRTLLNRAVKKVKSFIKK